MQSFRQVLDEAQDLGDEQLLASPSLEIGGVLTLQGFFSQALPLVTRAWTVWKDQPVQWQWASLAFMVTALVNLGRGREARAQVQDVLSSTDVPGNSRAMTFLNMSLATIAWVERSPEELMDFSQRAVASSRMNNDPLDTYIALAFQALAESHLGLTAAAQNHMQESQQLREKLGGQVFYSDWVAAIYAECALLQGEPERAIVLAEEAWNLARSMDGWYAQGLAQRTWAEALAKLEPENRATVIEHLEASLAAFEACEALVEQERTRAALAKARTIHE
jgi:hypothetical protein